MTGPRRKQQLEHTAGNKKNQDKDWVGEEEGRGRAEFVNVSFKEILKEESSQSLSLPPTQAVKF